MMNVAPNTIVANIHLRALFFRPRFAAATANTMVKLLESRTSVIIVEKAILGKIGNGVGQFSLENRT
jgi:hypothetical protein